MVFNNASPIVSDTFYYWQLALKLSTELYTKTCTSRNIEGKCKAPNAPSALYTAPRIHIHSLPHPTTSTPTYSPTFKYTHVVAYTSTRVRGKGGRERKKGVRRGIRRPLKAIGSHVRGKSEEDEAVGEQCLILHVSSWSWTVGEYQGRITKGYTEESRNAQAIRGSE